ncbi:hypothetical protein K6119_14090 [Paracrocinitomix mangrovi]|uniref:hypothetical protein n=1 Tax=Paracrocinitomix mangrovi TaxID=2862509 RepID=UPI001C8ED38A|nr:hypothetical protein [Paracrocinitomix mangrovi]UKN00861.1 hypothetical protein K6119_14090 [Paracrocinitomix mangrovi]
MNKKAFVAHLNKGFEQLTSAYLNYTSVVFTRSILFVVAATVFTGLVLLLWRGIINLFYGPDIFFIGIYEVDSFIFYASISPIVQSMPLLLIGLYAIALKYDEADKKLSLQALLNKLTPNHWKNFGIALTIIFVLSILFPAGFNQGQLMMETPLFDVGRNNKFAIWFFGLIAIPLALSPFYLATLCFHLDDRPFKFFDKNLITQIFAGTLLFLSMNFIAESLMSLITYIVVALLSIGFEEARLYGLFSSLLRIFLSSFVVVGLAKSMMTSADVDNIPKTKIPDSDILDDMT